MEIITRYKVIFDKNALEIMRNYLSNRWQKTKINTTFSFSLHYLEVFTRLSSEANFV